MFSDRETGALAGVSAGIALLVGFGAACIMFNAQEAHSEPVQADKGYARVQVLRVPVTVVETITETVTVEIPGPVQYVEVTPEGWLAPCEFEDSLNCYWDASEQGNGIGNDFVSP